jgi:cysteine synthase
MTTRRAVDSVLQSVGNTPLVRLRQVVPEGCNVWLKLEFFNPTGSYKDRMAVAVIEGAERKGLLRPGMRVVEYTGGSTGSSLAMVCAARGYRFQPLSSDAFSQEKLRTMQAFGAELEILESEGGRITPALFERFKTEIARMAGEPDTFYADQFNNPDVVSGYRGIGEELLAQLPGGVTCFCGAVGSGGMLMGVSQVLKPTGTRIVALEPATSPFLSTGKGGPHRVEGIGVGFWPGHLDAMVYDEIRAVDEGAAFEMARRLAKEEGILAGTSTGLNVAAAIALAKELGPGAKVVTVACDTGLKYIAGDLFR